MANRKQQEKQRKLLLLFVDARADSQSPASSRSARRLQQTAALKQEKLLARVTAGGQACLARYGVEHYRRLSVLAQRKTGSRPGSMRVIHWRVAPPVHDTLHAIAQQTGLPVNAVLRSIVDDWLATHRFPASAGPDKPHDETRDE